MRLKMKQCFAVISFAALVAATSWFVHLDQKLERRQQQSPERAKVSQVKPVKKQKTLRKNYYEALAKAHNARAKVEIENWRTNQGPLPTLVVEKGEQNIVDSSIGVEMQDPSAQSFAEFSPQSQLDTSPEALIQQQVIAQQQELEVQAAWQQGWVQALHAEARRQGYQINVYPGTQVIKSIKKLPPHMIARKN